MQRMSHVELIHRVSFESFKGAKAISDHLISAQIQTVIQELAEAGRLVSGQLLIIGASTSEAAGRPIGTAGSEQIAAQLFAGVAMAAAKFGFHPVFQCCEHLNRALVVEREVLRKFGLEEVAVVPMPHAGGSMAAYAYRHFNDPCVVETIQAHAGVDIGDTMIGMHLRRVAVPWRPSIRMIGHARVNAAYTRPKLIGGARAVYEQPQPNGSACD